MKNTKRFPHSLTSILAAALFGIQGSASDPTVRETRTPAEHQRRKASAQAKRDRRRLRAGGAA